MEKFCDITTRNELADFLRIPRKKLTHILYVEKPDWCYITFEIPKKNNGTRTINAPLDDLKEIQKKLAIVLSSYQKTIWTENKIHSKISHGFEKGKGIITNAEAHRNKRYLLNVDLENFFDSFHFGRVCGYFEKNRYFMLPHEVAVVIAQLVCYGGRLPQGAPSSPIITNLICQALDIKILSLARKYKMDYTRYADDLSFSTNNKNFVECKDEFVRELYQIIEQQGFSINEKKTRLQYRDSKQVVTGLVVNKKVNVERMYYKETRAMANHLYKYGEFTINGEVSTMNQLEGRFAFINQIDKHANLNKKENNSSFQKLNGRERQYQRFLFYKYFFANDKPLIITEGKTDIRYLKAALKNLYADYPELIEKHDDGTFDFKISFLNRTKRLRYFFGLSLDGADAIKNIVYFFVTTKKTPHLNYLNYFSKISGHGALKPVILVFDNELSRKEKPIRKFVREFNVEEKMKELATNLMIRMFDEGNLFLVTNPLVKGENECAIEMLFDEEVLDLKLNNKTLSLENDYDNKKYYGKDDFSKHILDNYQEIDFSNFKILLDNIKEIAKNYESMPVKD